MLEPEHETDTLARIGRDTPLYLRRAEADGGPLRHTLEAFIRQRFADEHQARIRHFLPCLLGLLDEHGVVQGAVGLRPARQPLFLERYLDAPLEGEIARRHARQVPRDAIVEVGNLAATGAASARLLIVALTDLLISEGFQWVAFTGTRELLNSFQRLGLAPLPLGEADPARLGAEREDWGSYYASRPQVMVGEILPGHRQLLQLGMYARLGHQPRYHGGLAHAVGC